MRSGVAAGCGVFNRAICVIRSDDKLVGDTYVIRKGTIPIRIGDYHDKV